MSPKFRIQVPATVLGTGLPMPKKREIAAELATEFLMDSPVIDWLGKARSLRQVSDLAGNSHEIEFATRQLFLALVAEGISYRDYRNRAIRAPELISEDARRAVDYFFHVFARSPELQSMGLGDGAILLARINHYMEQQIELDKKMQLSSISIN